VFNSTFNDFIREYNIENPENLNEFRNKFRNAIINLSSGNINLNELNELEELGNTLSDNLFDNLIYDFTG